MSSFKVILRYTLHSNTKLFYTNINGYLSPQRPTGANKGILFFFLLRGGRHNFLTKAENKKSSQDRTYKKLQYNGEPQYVKRLAKS